MLFAPVSSLFLTGSFFFITCPFCSISIFASTFLLDLNSSLLLLSSLLFLVPSWANYFYFAFQIFYFPSISEFGVRGFASFFCVVVKTLLGKCQSFRLFQSEGGVLGIYLIQFFFIDIFSSFLVYKVERGGNSCLSIQLLHPLYRAGGDYSE